MNKVLFVGDNRPTVKVFKRKLTEQGFLVLVAHNGKEAVEFLPNLSGIALF